MNFSRFPTAPTKGSALLTVLIIIFVMAMLSASILSYSRFEQRMDERTRLTLRSENVAENISLYAAEQLTVKLQNMGTPQVGRFPWTGPSTNTMIVYMPPASASGTDNVLVSEFNTLAATANMEVRAGIEAKTAYAKVDDVTSSNNGLQVATANVPIIAKGMATHPSLGTITTYVEQDMQLTLIPLFQFGMFYNMDLELYPSGELTLTGPVHTNNSLLAHPDVDSTNFITFMDRVTAADYIFAYQATKCDTRHGDGEIVTPPTTAQMAKGFVNFTDANDASSQISMKSTGVAAIYNGLATNLWADCRWGDTTRNITTALPTTTQLTSFRDWATNTYNGNLRAGIHGVTKLVLPGIGGYKETNDPSTAEDDRNNGRQIIESPDHKRYNGTAFVATTLDSADLKKTKFSWRAGLYIMVNPSDTARSGKLPNGTTITLFPRTYRCWLNTPSGNSHVCTEVVLPGQPTYGRDPGVDTVIDTADDIPYQNYLPNRLMTGTSVGSNQVLRTIQQTYGTGLSYQISGSPAAGTTSLTVSGGNGGTIIAGDVVTIGSYKYLVAADLSGTTLTLASPGLIAAASSGNAITVNAPVNNIGTGLTGYRINKSSAPTGYAAGTAGTPVFALAIDGGTGTIFPGNTISIASGSGTYSYLVTAATVAGTHTTIYIAKPGLVAAVNDNDPITITSTSNTLGSGANYVINTAPAVGATSLSINGGVGTLLPGNMLVLGPTAADRYLVTSMPNGTTDTTALTTVTITPALSAAYATGKLVILDPSPYSGYATTGNGGSGSVFPADGSTAPYAAEAYFYDIRRANNNGAMGASSDRAAFNRSGTNPYTPRPIAKIDFDMARFKMMVNRVISGATTSSGYTLTLPGGSGAGWGNCIYNGDTATAMVALGLGIYDGTTATYSAAVSFPAASPSVRQNPFGIYKVPLTAADQAKVYTDPTALAVSAAELNAAWYDGVAVYIHSVDAEVRAQTTPGIADRVDSGVRLLNGRGPVASLAPDSPDTLSGCSIATNDAVYIIGHYNANGNIESNKLITGNGGYSSKWPDSSSEYLCSVYGDATTIISQPTYTESGTSPNLTYAQTAGWNDAFSAMPISVNVTGWNTGALGDQDGVFNPSVIRPGALPNINKPGTQGTAIKIKLAAVPTEISTALIIGLVPSNHNPAGLSDLPPCTTANNVNSGGANNFPRFLEKWGDSAPLYIRGSMVALFESRVAMEPFTHSRCYDRPLRRWGLHNNLSVANHHVPLEPIVYSADRLGFRQLTPAQYATRKAQIEGWTELVP